MPLPVKKSTLSCMNLVVYVSTLGCLHLNTRFSACASHFVTAYDKHKQQRLTWVTLCSALDTNTVAKHQHCTAAVPCLM